ncbi:MAG: cobalamin-dependent protein [Candidatus Aenigmatarchaeota archaeon]
MDILFVNPRGTFTPMPPLGLMIMSAVVREKGFTVAILDAENRKLDDRQLEEEIRRFKPAIVGVPVFTPTYGQALDAMRTAKRIDPSITTVAGGSHASIYPEILDNKEVDYVVRGEGEITFLELVEFILHGKGRKEEIKGISYMENGCLVNNPARELIQDLDKIPWPARDLLPIEKYPGILMPKRRPETQVMGMRGCPFRCAFCSSAVFGKTLRYRNPLNVVDEVEFLVERYGIKTIYFFDDGLNYRADWLNTICDEFIKRGLNEKMEWKGQVRVNSQFVNQELLNKMHKAGCWLLAWGIESGNQNVLNNIHKSITLQEVENAIRMSAKAGIRNMGFFMAGNMTETKETVNDTIRFAKKLMHNGLDYVQWALATPYPGTEFYEVCKKNGWIKVSRWEDWRDDKRHVIIDMPGLPQAWMQQSYEDAYRAFYMNPYYIARQVSKIRSIDDVKLMASGLGWVRRAIKET